MRNESCILLLLREIIVCHPWRRRRPCLRSCAPLKASNNFAVLLLQINNTTTLFQSSRILIQKPAQLHQHRYLKRKASVRLYGTRTKGQEVQPESGITCTAVEHALGTSVFLLCLALIVVAPNILIQATLSKTWQFSQVLFQYYFLRSSLLLGTAMTSVGTFLAGCG